MKPVPRTVERILELIGGAQTICIVGHVRPDGDCIGSQVGLALALEAAGKQVTVWNQDPVPDKLRFLDPERRLTRSKPGHRFDLVIATDCASAERLGRVLNHVGDRGHLINIDHHASNTCYGDVNWVSPREPSTGELIFDLCAWAGWTITRPIANCLFAAISTDTGSFQYPSVVPETLHTAAELVERGADLGHICQEIYQSFPITRVRLLRHVYSTFRLTHDGRTAYFWLKKANYSRAGADIEESEGLIDHIRSIEGVQVAVVFEESGDELTRISLRSKTEAVNVSDIAGLFGGGGHRAAAGARVQGSALSAQRRVLGAVKRALAGKPAR